jgi:hypothetical protein
MILAETLVSGHEVNHCANSSAAGRSNSACPGRRRTGVPVPASYPERRGGSAPQVTLRPMRISWAEAVEDAFRDMRVSCDCRCVFAA